MKRFPREFSWEHQPGLAARAVESPYCQANPDSENLTEQPVFGRSRKGGEDTHPRRAQQVCRPDDTRIAAAPAML